jgi:hypothetical protein
VELPRLAKAIVLVLPFLGAPALAQDQTLRPSLSIASDPALKLDKRGFAFPIIEYSDPTGARQQRKGIIAGQEVAPGTIVGVGLFETAPRARGFLPEMNPNARPKRSRQAAVGLSWRF